MELIIPLNKIILILLTAYVHYFRELEDNLYCRLCEAFYHLYSLVWKF